MPLHRNNSRRVLIVGGGNAERVLSISAEEYKPGRKHTLPPSLTVGGGSSINHACRLLATGINVFPIVPVINDDTGRLVVQSLSDAAQTGGIKFRFKHSWYMPKVKESQVTQFTTIINIGEDRNVFSEIGDDLIDSFSPHYDHLIEEVERNTVSAVMIGHVYADKDLQGEITRDVIDKFFPKALIIANFGASQYDLGHRVWKKPLDKISCFQLDILEMRRFFRNPSIRIREMLAWFRERCTVVVTLERMGAVAQIKGSSRIFFVWPYELPLKKIGDTTGDNHDKIVDTTGAGDAFAAGLTWGLIHGSSVPQENDEEEEWKKLLQRSALWAAYACCQKGGTMDCPNLDSLIAFEKRNSSLVHSVDVFDSVLGERLLRLIDRAFP